VASIACIVEGHGEVEALPELLRRIASSLEPPVFPTILLPTRVPGAKLQRKGELEKAVELLGRRTSPGDAVFILLDCDDGCPAEMAPELLRRAQAARPDRTIAVVLAKREFEAWFLASAVSLRSRRGLSPELVPPPRPEGIRDAKGWLSSRRARGRAYKEAVDQPALAGVFDIQAARTADSFDKCYREAVRLLRGLGP
jgi:hypothetical protein